MERRADSVQKAKGQNKELQQNRTTIVVRVFGGKMKLHLGHLFWAGEAALGDLRYASKSGQIGYIN